MSHSNHIDVSTLAGRIHQDVEVHAQRCYQCGKCSAGCPVADIMEYPPSQVMRMLQTETPENEEKILKSNTIWLCVTCEMCLTRCPMEIDIPNMMDYLRQISIKEKKNNPKAKNIIAFHKAFLGSIKRTGRLYELGLLAEYKIRSFTFLQDVALALPMYVRGKLHIFPESIKGTKHLAKIFKKTSK